MDGLVLESSDSSGRRRCFLDSAGNNSSVFQKDKTCGSCRIAGTAGGGVAHECLPENFVARIRPYEVVEGLRLMIERQRDYSFPSGHTSASFAAACALVRTLPKNGEQSA